MAIYDADASDVPLLLARQAGGLGYYAIVEGEGHLDGQLVGFCCFGPEARVRGQTVDDSAIDIGGGIRPELLSQRLASAAFPLIFDLGRRLLAPERFRVAVAAFNTRSLRLCESAGFVAVRKFDDPGQPFVEMIRQPA